MDHFTEDTMKTRVLNALAAITLVAAGLAEALRDGRLDHIERHALAEQARGLQPFLLRLANPPSRSAEEA